MNKVSLVHSMLAQLSPAPAAIIAPHERMADVRAGMIISPAHAVFPVSGIVSIRAANMGPEVASVGREGGICVRIDDRFEVVAQTPCVYVHLPVLTLAKFALDHPEIARLKSQCDDWLLAQARHIAVCNGLHTGTQRIARWLLRASEALDSESIPIIQSTVATALGLERTTVTVTIGDWLAPAVSTGRGRITIKDRAALRAIACDCCSAFGRKHWPRLIPADDADEEAA